MRRASNRRPADRSRGQDPVRDRWVRDRWV